MCGATRHTLTVAEHPWLDRDIPAGSTVYLYEGCTYGCVSSDGEAITLTNEPLSTFYEVPLGSVQWEAAAGSPTRMEPQPIVPASSHRSDENHDPEPEK